MKINGSIEYEYKNLKIGGGGFVTGISFHPSDSKTLYIRTDIGGIYKYDFDNEKWFSLCDSVKATDPAETFPLAIALDPDNKDMLLSACGDKENNFLCISYDGGNSFIRRPLPCCVHGNEVGRATGERLFFFDGKIYFGSQTAGILISSDMGKSWQNAELFGETNISALWINHSGNSFDFNGDLAIAGCSGEKNSPDGKTRGNTLYYSANGMKSFCPLSAPAPVSYAGSDYYGYVPQRITCDDKYIYITFSATGRVAFGKMGAYACDTGDLCDGRVYRYKISNGVPVFDKDVTPSDKNFTDGRKTDGGYCGICAAYGIILLSTVCRKSGDIIYLSRDRGESWQKTLHGLDIGKFDWNISYMKPQFNGGGNCMHWISDIKLSPHNPDLALFNTGTGVFAVEGLQSGDYCFKAFSEGIEETVHLNVYTTPFGRTRILDIVGDLGGFAYTDYDTECENSFADENGNRYITCLNADFTLSDPDYILATPRGNWTGKTKGGLILSKDGGASWRRLGYPHGLSKKLDQAIERIKQPNVNSGWTALSADGKRILWAVSGGRGFPADTVCYSDDEGESWKLSKFTDLNGKSAENLSVTVYSDYYDENLFFALSYSYPGNFGFFVSKDKGANFVRLETDIEIPCPGFSRFQLSRQPDESGIFWLANGVSGLYRFEVSLDHTKVEIKNILNSGAACCIGFGKGKGKSPAMYITGTINEEYGFYISNDLGESFSRINSDSQQFGVINAVCGDMREYGVFCLATGTRGLIYGRMKDTCNGNKTVI